MSIYEPSPWDNDYETFLRTTRKASENKDAKQEIQNLLRIVVPNGEGEFIVHDLAETCYDSLGNEKKFYRHSLGLFHRPVPEYKIRMNEDYEKETYTAGYNDMRTEYSIPFTTKKADELHKISTDKTAYLISLGRYKEGRRIRCDNFEKCLCSIGLATKRFSLLRAAR